MANGIYKVTEEFEKELSKYTGAPYAVAIVYVVPSITSVVGPESGTLA